MFPKRTYHLRILLISLAVIALGLAIFLFGVRMEAVAPVTGVIEAREVVELRALLPGLADPGWIDATAGSPGGAAIPVRLGRDGNGLTQPTAADPSRPVHQHELIAGELKLPVREGAFHKLQPGDLLWPGQPVVAIRNDELRFRYEKLTDQIADLEIKGQSVQSLQRERERLRQQLDQSVLHAPTSGAAWLVLEVPAAPLEAVKAGDVLATLVEVDPATGLPRDLVARLDIEERHWGEVAIGQPVRLRSTVHNHRLHGMAEGRIERLEPLGSPGAKGERYFHAIAAITTTPFPLPLGSSCRGEVIVGRKLVYRIILEH